MTPDKELERLADEEVQLRGERDRAHRAARMLEDDLFTGAVQAVRENIRRDFEDSDLEDDAGRRIARIALDMLTKVVANIHSHMETGKLADVQIAKIEEKRKKLRLWKRNAA